MAQNDIHVKKHLHGEDSVKRNAEHETLIRCLAQELYERRGGAPGHELDDWLEAERRVMNKAMMTGSRCSRG